MKSRTKRLKLKSTTNKSKSTTLTSNHENEGEIIKTQRANTGPRLQNNGNLNSSNNDDLKKYSFNFSFIESTFSEASSTSRINPRSANQTTKKTNSSITFKN